MLNKTCPICGAKLLEDEAIKLDYAGRTICPKCADWLENTEWD